MAFTHQTNLVRTQESARLTQNKAAELRKRIDDLKRQQNVLYMKPINQSDDDVYQNIANACNDFVKLPDEANQARLAKILQENELQLHAYRYDPTSETKRRVARMAFNGSIDRPQEYAFSNILREMKNNPLKREKVNPNDYDLSHSTVWNVFREIPEFVATEENVKKGLSIYGIPPEKLSELKWQDFAFILNEQYRSGYNSSAKVFNESYKARHTKRFIRENEAEFRQGMMSIKGVRKDYVDALVNAMKKGCTDLTKSHFWKEEWRNQPVIDVHHIVNVKDASVVEDKGKSFSSVNDYSNMCFIVRHPQHNAMHALEQDLNNNYHEDIFYNRKIDDKFIYRIQPHEHVKCMGPGFCLYDREALGVKQHSIRPQKEPLKKWADQCKGRPYDDRETRRYGWNNARSGNE